MKSAIARGTAKARPGEKAYGLISIPDALADGSPVELPVAVVNGGTPGPLLYVQAAQHGEELNGFEAARRVVASVNPAKLSGALTYCLPNPLALRERARTTAFDDVNMNRIWPGNPEGTVTERAAHTVWVTCIAGKADCVIDLHTGIRKTLTHTIYEAGKGAVYEMSRKLSIAFGAKYCAREIGKFGGGRTCTAQCCAHGIPAITAELGARFCFDETTIQNAVRGITNIMKHMGMIGRAPIRPKRQTLWELEAIPSEKGERRGNVRAPKGGLFAPTVKVGAMVKRGSAIGVIYSPRTFGVVANVEAPISGMVYHVARNPAVNSGDKVACVAKVVEVIR